MSMNCQGLANPQKRRDIFHYLRKKSYSIYLLQDTHFDPKLEHCIRAEWGNKCYFASYNSSSRGVAILFDGNFEFSVKKVYKDIGGNYIFASIQIMNKELLIISIYGPNRDDPVFYVELEKRIKEIGTENVVIGGDWNLVLDFDLDYHNYKHSNNIKAQEQVDNMMTNLDLLDVWRELNPEMRRYTWRRNTPFQQSRLDFFLTSDLLSTYVTDADIKPGYRTDHSIITLTVTFGKETKRHLFWKFNRSLLRDKAYADEVNGVIESVIEEYAALPYLREQLPRVPKDKIQFVISDQLFLDVLLMKIRAKTIAYATMKKRKNEEKEKELENNIETLEKKIDATTEEKRKLENDKNELYSIREKKMEGVLLRSRARWIADGEKITKYFCGLEKRNYISKQMTKLTLNNGKDIYDSQEIVNEVKTFYEKLYTKRDLEDCDIFDMVTEIPTLNLQEKNSLEGEILLEEASIALKNMKNNKSPGTDGFTTEFFKFFWLQLGTFVVRALNEGFKKGELSSTQKEGLIICIPKGDKAKEFIKNWRPISLLNVIYKIGSTCIANRLKKVLPSLINEDQTGFISNRFIGDNIRLIYDLISYLNEEDLPGLLLCLDFEKAFDSVDWKFMFKVLYAFGFGPDICKWICTFYTNIKSAILVNGQISQWFPVQRGCRQGDPISPYLFILCVEILAIMIRQNENIKGIQVGETNHKISQYADDTEIMLAGDKKSFEETVNTIENFSKKSGLFLNAGKTSAIWLGSRRNSLMRYMPHLQMDWNPPKFKILGIWFTNDLKECEKLNFNEKLSEVKALYKIWLKRQITPLGRVAVLKSLILSKLVYLWILLPNPPNEFIETLQKTVFEFVWNRKQDRINRKTAVKSIKKGGLGIPDIKKYVSALKLIWIRKLNMSNHMWKNIIQTVYPKANLLEKLGSSYNNDLFHVNRFWSDVFQAYREIGLKVKPQTPDELNAEPIFLNENIKIGNKVIFYKLWLNRGVCFIRNVLDESGSFLSYENFKEIYGINTNYLTYIGCIQAIKSYIRRTGLDIESNKSSKLSKVLQFIQSSMKGARSYYEMLTSEDVEPKCCSKWDDKLNTNIKWDTTFLKVHNIKEIKLKWFQIRIVNRILATNITLQHMGIERDSDCTFCMRERESIQHIFWRCEHIGPFWQQFQLNVNRDCGHSGLLTLNENIVLFGHDSNFESDEIFDLILLLAKFFIYKCRINRNIPRMDLFKRYLKTRYETEKYISRVNMTFDNFMLKWHYYTYFLDTEL